MTYSEPNKTSQLVSFLCCERALCIMRLALACSSPSRLWNSLICITTKMKKKMSNNMYHICNECNRFVPHQSVHLWTVEELDVEQTQCMKLWWVQLPRLQIQSQLSPTPTSLVRVDRLHSLKDSFIHFNKGYRIEQFKWKFLISEEN